MGNVDTCVYCGECVPEGMMVCPNCLEKLSEPNGQIHSRSNNEIGERRSLFSRFRNRRKV